MVNESTRGDVFACKLMGLAMGFVWRSESLGDHMLGPALKNPTYGSLQHPEEIAWSMLMSFVKLTAPKNLASCIY